MKNVKRLLVAAVALLSASSMAALIQSATPISEDAPFRISTGLKSGLLRNDSDKTGVNNFGIGLGFAHNVGYDFTYGVAASLDYAGWERHRVVFGDDNDNKFRTWPLNVELSASFLPEVAERLHVGALLGLGWTNHFGEVAANQRKNNDVKFGDLGLRAGIGLNYGVSDAFSFYVAPSYTLTGIRFLGDKAPAEAKSKRNYSGVEIPVGFWFAASENVGVYLDVNTKFTDFSNFTKSWREDFTLGVAFAI